MRILIVEDEEKIVSVIKSFLESKDFLVFCAKDGEEAMDIFRKEDIGFVLLDLMLPRTSGEEVCRQLRKISKVPVIMLTAKSGEADMLHGLGLGADDYITKPFSLRTLYARMEAVLRRSAELFTPKTGKYVSRDGVLTVDFENRLIIKNGEEIRLTPNEYKILTAMTGNPNKVFTRDDLITEAFGNDFDGYDRTIDSHIKNIRQKLEDDVKNPVYIKTIHGVGYKFGGE